MVVAARPWVRRRAAALIVVAALAMPAAAAGEPDPPPTSAAKDGSIAGLVDDVARVPEARAGEELVDRRTTYSSTYATDAADEYRTVISQEPVNFRAADGWKRIDSRLEPASGGGWQNRANGFVTKVSPSTSGKLVELDLGRGRAISWSLAGGSSRGDHRQPVRTAAVEERAQRVPAARHGDRDVAFAGAIEGVDVEIQSRSSGVKETLVLASAHAPDSYTFPLEVAGLVPRQAEDGSIELVDGSGAVAGTIPAGWMEDASGDPRTAVAPADAVRYELVSTKSGYALVIKLSREWLDDPTRIFPVRVDPTVLIGLTAAPTTGTPTAPAPYDDTKVVALVNNTDYRLLPQLQVGRDLLYQRSFLHFDLSAIPSDDALVTGAQLNLKVESGTCDAANPVEARRVTAATWGNNPAPNPNTFPVWPGPATTASAAVAEQICPTAGDPVLHLRDTDRLRSNSMLRMIQGWVDQPSTNFGLGLKARTETSTMALNLKFTSANGAPGAGPTINVVWFDAEPRHLQVDGDDGNSTDTNVTPVTYTDFSGGETCYPEYGTGAGTVPAPSTWGTSPDCRIDLYWNGTPVTDQKTIVYVHGGGFMVSNDSMGLGRRRSEETHRWASALAERGYLVAVIDYRQALAQVLRNRPAGMSEYEILLAAVTGFSHCTQRFEPDGSTPHVWPPPDHLAADPGQPDPPPECASVAAAWDELSTVGWGTAVEEAVEDLQQAVRWLRTDPDGVLAGRGIDPGKVFLVGASAGGFAATAANFDPDSVALGHADVDGAVSLGAGYFVDPLPIDDPARPLLPATGPDKASPLQVQKWEQDLVSTVQPAPIAPNDRWYTGDFDYARQSAAHLRDLGYQVELRSRPSFGHTPDPNRSTSFDHGLGETVSFLDRLAAGQGPVNGYWKGISAASNASTFSPLVGQDLMNDQGVPYEPVVGDFNRDDIEDILWWLPSGERSALWFGQADGSFARNDLSYPQTGDDDLTARARIVDPADIPGGDNFAMGNYPETTGATKVLVGDFDGDCRATTPTCDDDIYWYGAGSGKDYVWYSNGDTYGDDLASTGTFQRVDRTETDSFEGVEAGDFNGDGRSDLYFYEDAGNDRIWYGQATRTFDSRSISSSPDGARELRVGNFDGDTNGTRAIDDLLYLSPAPSGSWTVRYGSTTLGTLASVTPAAQIPASLPTRSVTAVGNWNGLDGSPSRSYQDLYFYNSGSTTDKIWYGTSTRGTFATKDVTGTPTGARELSVGDFDGDARNDLVLHPVGAGNETLLRGLGNVGLVRQGLSVVDLGDTIPGDRRAVIGRFQDQGATWRDDIVWHVTSSRADHGPGSGWWWY